MPHAVVPWEGLSLQVGSQEGNRVHKGRLPISPHMSWVGSLSESPILFVQ